MATFKFFWKAHRWTGIVVAAVVVTSTVTGFMLLLKKRIDWIQPPTLQGAAGGAEDSITVDIHDGSFWAGWWHDWVMPVFGVGLAFMTASGLWLWVEPTLRRRRRKRCAEGSGG